jgi:type IX secretion system PorP/SprF family membrane protein
MVSLNRNDQISLLGMIFPMNRASIFIVVLHICASLGAQQLPIWGSLRETQTLLNPGAPSFDFLLAQRSVSLGSSYRYQWIQQDNNPRTFQARYDQVLMNNNAAQLMYGGHLIADQTGPTGFLGGYGRVGVMFSDDPEYSGISAGIGAGFVQYRLQTNKLILREPEAVPTNGLRTQFYPDLSLGAFAWQTISSNDDKIFGGISVPKLLALNLNFRNDQGMYNIKQIPHFSGQAGIIHPMNEDQILVGTLSARYAQGIPFNLDAQVWYKMPTGLFLGAGFGTARTISVESGFYMPDLLGDDRDFRAGYQFSHSFQTFGGLVGSIHELNVSMTLR